MEIFNLCYNICEVTNNELQHHITSQRYLDTLRPT